jgi:AP-1 complex subunit mu
MELYYSYIVVTVAKRNPNFTLIFAFLHKLKDILVSYFQELEEESIRDNFVLIYELLDEIMDHGYPQITDTKILKEIIKTHGYKMSRRQQENEDKNQSQKDRTGMCARVPGLVYRVNKAFLDVVEEVNSLVS